MILTNTDKTNTQNTLDVLKNELLSESNYNELAHLLAMLKILKPMLYDKIFQTGIIASSIGFNLNVREEEFFIACFYSNIGLLAVSNIYEKDDFLSNQELDIIKRHPLLSENILNQRGYKQAALYAKTHHETPDLTGYYKIGSYPKESNYINIADIFSGCIYTKTFKPPLTLNEAIEVSLKSYKNALIIKKDELSIITDVLNKFYFELIY